jgi:hypothetical protein
LPRRLTEIAEYVIEAKPRTIGIIGFQYDLKDSKTGGKIGTVTIKKDVDVFRLYKSFDLEEVEAPKKLILKKLTVGAVVILVAGLLITTLLNRAFHVQTESKPLLKTPAGHKDQVITKSIPEDRKWKKDKEPENQEKQYYIFVEGGTGQGKRPGGKLRGVSKTNEGVYYFYE